MGNSRKGKSPASDASEAAKGGIVLQEFYSNEARSSFRTMSKRKVIQERGIMNKPPFDAYINPNKWQSFCSNPLDANLTMATEFYANMRFIDLKGDVLFRGKMVRITPEIINKYYGLEPEETFYTAFNKLKSDASVDSGGELVGIWPEIVREVTQTEFSMEEILPQKTWGHIDKKYLTMEMNVWYTFVAAHLIPVTINSEVQWERLRLLYCLKKNIAINVGSTILSSIKSFLVTNSGLGCHSLVTALCHNAGCEDKMDDHYKSPMGMLNYDSFKRRNKVPTPPPTLLEGETEERAGIHKELAARVANVEADVRHVKQTCDQILQILQKSCPEAMEKSVADETSGGL